MKVRNDLAFDYLTCLAVLLNGCIRPLNTAPSKTTFTHISRKIFLKGSIAYVRSTRFLFDCWKMRKYCFITLSIKPQSCSNALTHLSGISIDLRLRKMCSQVFIIMCVDSSAQYIGQQSQIKNNSHEC